MKILDKSCYETALKRLDELEMLVTENTLKTDANYLEMDELIDAIDAYEAEAYPIAKPTLGATIQLRMHEMGLTQTRLSEMLGVSSSAIHRYIIGKSEPSLSVARRMSRSLNIDPAVVLGV